MVGSRLIVLCVEDDPDIRHIMRLALAMDADFQIYQADSAEDAVVQIRAGLKPDMVLLDDQLPGSNGSELIKSLRNDALGCRPKVAFVTAACRPGDIDRFYSLGAVGVILKPFDPIMFADEVRQLYLGRTPFHISI